MDTKKFLALLAAIITLSIFISLLFIFSKSISSSPSSSLLEECKPISYNGKGINLLFFSTKGNAEKYSETLLSNEAFADSKESFNVYYIDEYTPKCELYKSKALLCSGKELITKAASCPNDYIFVIQAENGEIRSSAFSNVASINENNPVAVILHEFGHLFGNLAEEYVPASIPLNARNCAESCDEFNGVLDSCHQGCSKENYYRSIESGVMRTLKSYNYGVFNEQILKNKIPQVYESSGLTGLAVDDLDCSQNNYYLLKGRYNKDEITIAEKSVMQGCAPSHSAGDITYKLASLSGEEISSREFNPSVIFTDNQAQDEDIIGGETFPNTGQAFFLAIPMPKERAESIEFYENNNPIGRSSLSDIGARPCKI